MLVIKNKKGIVFWPIMVVFSAIIFLAFIYLLASSVNPPSDFGDQFSDVFYTQVKYDSFSTYIDSFEVSMKQNFGNLKASNGASFLKQNFLSSNSVKTPNNVEKCEVGNIFYWYHDKENINCSSFINRSYLAKVYEYKFQNEAEKLKGGFSLVGVQTNSICEFNDSGVGNCTFDISSQNKGSLRYEKKLTQDFNFSEYFELVNKTKGAVDKYKEEYEIKISKCISNINNKGVPNIQAYCYNETLEDYLRDEGIKNYKIEIKSEARDGGKYVRIETRIKKDGELRLKFGLYLENNIPPQPISFTVERKKNEDKELTVKIREPASSGAIAHYVIAYAYHNFSNDKAFVEKLNQEKVPLKMGSDLTGCNRPHRKVSKESTDLYKKNDITLRRMKDSKLDFSSKSSSGSSIDNVYLGKIGNESNGQCEMVDFKSEEVYVYVYAINKDNSYWKQDVSKIIQKIKPLNLRGPKPLFVQDDKVSSPKRRHSFFTQIDSFNKKPQVTLTGDIKNTEKTIRLAVNDYKDDDFAYYTLMVADNVFAIDNCGNKKGCVKISKGITNPNPIIYLTSDSSFSAPEQNALVYNDRVLPSIEFNNYESYYVALVPMTKNNVGYSRGFYQEGTSPPNPHSPVPIKVINNTKSQAQTSSQNSNTVTSSSGAN